VRVEDWRAWLDEQFFDTNPAREKAPPVETEPPPGPLSAPVPDPKGAGAAAQAPPEPRWTIAEPPPVARRPAPVEPRGAASEDVAIPEIEQYLPFLRTARQVPEPPARAAEPAGEAPGEPVADSETVVVHAPAEAAVGSPFTEAPGTERTGADAEMELDFGWVNETPASSLKRTEDVAPRAGSAGASPSRLPASASRPTEDVGSRVGSAGASPSRLPASVSTPTGEVPESESAPESPGVAAVERPAEAASRRVRPRGRSARNVAPIELAPPMSSDAFWHLAPRHVRTLIAMGQDDGVQNSYKRQFRESRLALIERLLDPTLSLEDTARLLNVCPTTVRRYTNRGLIRHQRTPGDQRRFKLSDVLSFMEAQQGQEDWR
jgi:excisionase family DNA binding protein